MNDGLMARESSLVRLYMELTGASESMARGVLMHVCCKEGDNATLPEACEAGALPQEEPAVGSLGRRVGNGTGWASSVLPVAAPG